jgi:hypothetical protein
MHLVGQLRLRLARDLECVIAAQLAKVMSGRSRFLQILKSAVQ